MASLRLRDVATGVSYDAVGRPVGGSGEPLLPLAGYNQFWFAWSAFNHGSEIFRRNDGVHTAPIAAGGECAVPCQQIHLGCPGKDCIPALSEPPQTAAGASDAKYLPDNAFVVGVEVAGEARAYPHNVLWWHEIVNDRVAGVPIAITHCPLTFSSIGYDPDGFEPGKTVELGVSGRLFNSNLVFYDRSDGTWYSQLLGIGTKGAALGTPAPRIHVWEMTWAAWRIMHPESTVLSSATGFARDYQRYPYGDYFIDDHDTFGPIAPAPDPTYPNKALTYGVRIGGAAKAYAHRELTAWARDQRGPDAPAIGVVNDVVGGHALAVVFDIDAGYVQAFDREGRGELELVP